MIRKCEHIEKHTAIKMMDTISESLSVKSLDEFKQCVTNMQNLFSYHHSFCMFTNQKKLATQKNPQIELIDVSYPKGLLDVYFKTGSNTVDPVTKELFRTGSVQQWNNAFKKYGYSYPSWARDLDIMDGISHACFEPEYLTAAIFSFNRVEKRFKQRNEAIIQYMVPHLTEAMKKCLGIDQLTDIRLQSTLTPREIEILKWLKHGKSSWEISKILKIGERTVNYHVNNIKEKLGAVNRTQAVAIALSKGKIQL